MRPKMKLYVRLRASAGKDRLGNKVHEHAQSTAVDGCLFAPGISQDLAASKPEGVKVSATVFFPRGWSSRLRGALVSTDEKRWLKVVGDPLEYPCEMLPKGFPYSCAVMLEAYDG